MHEWLGLPVSDLSGEVHMVFPLDDLRMLLDICPESWEQSVLLVWSDSTGILQILQEHVLVNGSVKVAKSFLTAIITDWTDVIQVAHRVSFFLFLVLNRILEACESAGFHDNTGTRSHEVRLRRCRLWSGLYAHLNDYLAYKNTTMKLSTREKLNLPRYQSSKSRLLLMPCLQVGYRRGQTRRMPSGQLAEDDGYRSDQVDRFP